VKIYAFDDPGLYPIPVSKPTFKYAAVVGTWHKEPCDCPGRYHSRLVSPLRIDWDTPGSRIADVAFSWGSPLFFGSANLTKVFDQIGGHFLYEPILIDFRGLGVDLANEIRRKHFVWPRPKKTISIDIGKNAMEEETECPYCGRRRLKYKYDGITVERSDIDPVDAFHIAEIGRDSPTFVTAEYAVQFKRFDVENVTLREVGIAA
jgi:hypothetical protein